jgi:Tannase and feruloyl esterase
MIQVNTTNGITVATPDSLSQNFIQYLLKQDPTYDTSNITYSDFTSLFFQSSSDYDRLLGSNNPDLSAFRKSGGKLLSWHGLADNLVGSNSTLNYRQRVDALMGGTHSVDSFYRLFFPPGVNHCGAGYGPVPVSALDELVAWVEHGTAPDTLAAKFVDLEGEVVTHDICKYPLVSKYIKGDPKVATSYICTDSF